MAGRRQGVIGGPRRLAGCLVMVPVLAACTGGSQEMSAPTASIQARDDQFSPFREYATAEIRMSTPPSFAAPQLMAVRLLGRVDRKTGALATLLRVEIAYTGNHRRMYETARNERAETLRLEIVQRHGQCRPNAQCTYSEVLSVELPEAQLRQAPAEGYRLKLFARNGPEVAIGVPRAQITELLGRIDADRARPATTAAR